MLVQKFRLFTLCFALGITSFSAPVLAHGDPTEMGAGPGSTEKHHKEADGSGNAAQSAEMQDMMDEGTMPMMPDGSVPVWAG